jgi:hypothetical protein
MKNKSPTFTLKLLILNANAIPINIIKVPSQSKIKNLIPRNIEIRFVKKTSVLSSSTPFEAVEYFRPKKAKKSNKKPTIPIKIKLKGAFFIEDNSFFLVKINITANANNLT